MSADVEDPDARLKGMEPRYEVKKIHDPEGKHDTCGYFVLDPLHDPIAALAVSAYAKEARRQGYVPLADDLDGWLKRIQAEALLADQVDVLIAEREVLDKWEK